MTKKELQGWSAETLQAIEKGLEENNLLLEDIEDLWVTNAKEYLEEYYSSKFIDRYIQNFIKEEELLADLLEEEEEGYYIYNENDLIIFYLK